MKKKLLFVHIAKTGGTSIRRMLNKATPKIEYDCIHNGKLIRHQNNKIVRQAIGGRMASDDYDYTAFFVRNPYARLLSCYKYFYGGGLNQFNDKTFQGDKDTQELIKKQFPKFQDCCHNLKEFCEIITHARPMTECIESSCSLPSNQKAIIQGRFESYNESVINLFSHLGTTIQTDDILKINLSSQNDQFKYDAAMKEEVYQFYKNDFDHFNYDK